MGPTLPQPTRLAGVPTGRPGRRRRRSPPSRLLRLRWRGEALALRLLLALLRGRSHTTMRRGIRLACRLAAPALAQRLSTAGANLERVYGDQLSPAQRRQLAGESLQSFFLSCLESIIQPVDPQRITAEGEGLAALMAMHRRGEAVIVGSLHLGCWDLGLRWLSERLPHLAVIYRPAHNPHADALLNAARSANSHCRWISQFDARGILQSLRDGCGLVVMTDLYSHRTALMVDFLGLRTRFATGPVALSQKTGAPLFPVAHVRGDDGRFRLICGAPLQPGHGPEALAAQAAALARWHEPWIQAYAEQYYWINRRWRPGDGSGERLRPIAPPAPRALAAGGEWRRRP
ncbi:putative Lipid A biosynthesis acyltransferase [Cyanobium sp. NIES-981]|nr:putative Lipid A biosynthesis acyltransferase [Cyanobium sp. NIES-981]